VDRQRRNQGVQVPIPTHPIPTVPIPTFIFGHKSIHASDVRNCHCTFGGNFIRYASCVGHFSMFTSAQLRLSVTHYFSRISPLCAHISRIFSLIVSAYLGIFPIFFAHISCLYTAHIREIVTRFSGFPRYITHSVAGFPA